MCQQCAAYVATDMHQTQHGSRDGSTEAVDASCWSVPFPSKTTLTWILVPEIRRCLVYESVCGVCVRASVCRQMLTLARDKPETSTTACVVTSHTPDGYATKLSFGVLIWKLILLVWTGRASSLCKVQLLLSKGVYELLQQFSLWQTQTNHVREKLAI